MSKLEKRKYRINLEGFVTPKNNDEFVDLLKEATNGEYEMLSKFSMMNGYGRFSHAKCGSIFRTNPYKLLIEGEGCPDCKDKVDISHILYKNKYDIFIKHGKFAKEVFDKYSHEYIVTGVFVSETHPIEIVHTKCGEKFKRTPNSILNNAILCPKCNPRIAWTLDKLKKEIKAMTKGEFVIVDKEYKDIDTPIKIRHKLCKQVFEDTPNAFMKTPKCKICEGDMSINEKRIKDYLTKSKIQFEREYSIDGCKHRNILRFDFAIFKNDELMCLVEYDGEHHYYPVYDEESFVKVQITDKTKDRFCKDNKIELIRIPFWKNEDLEKILAKELKSLGVL